MKQPRILGIFAHPDDEVFCAGGTFAKYADEGAYIKIISVTPGNAGQIRDANIATRRTLGAVRARELENSCKVMGVQEAECWDYGDGTLQQTDQVELIVKIEQAIRTFKPDIVITFGPDGGYGHPDHVAVSEATTVACFHCCGDVENFNNLRLFHAYFPAQDMLFSDKLVNWLMSFDDYYLGTPDFVLALTLLAEETSMLQFASDHVQVCWFPPGFYIIEQGEPANKLYLMLSGQADVLREDEQGHIQKINTIPAGRFFGEDGIAYQRPRSAHVVATESSACLVFSPEKPTKFAGRGENAQFAGEIDIQTIQENQSNVGQATACIDVDNYIYQKIKAIAQHRSQFPIQPDMFPLDMLKDLFGKEYFVQVIPPPRLDNTLTAR